MTNYEQAFLNGFVKRASDCGVDKETSMRLIKESKWKQVVKGIQTAASLKPQSFPGGVEAAKEAILPFRKNIANVLRQGRNEGRVPAAALTHAGEQYRRTMHDVLPTTNPMYQEKGVHLFNKPLAETAGLDTDWHARLQKNLASRMGPQQPAPVAPIAKKRGLLASLFGY